MHFVDKVVVYFLIKHKNTLDSQLNSLLFFLYLTYVFIIFFYRIEFKLLFNVSFFKYWRHSCKNVKTVIVVGEPVPFQFVYYFVVSLPLGTKSNLFFKLKAIVSSFFFIFSTTIFKSLLRSSALVVFSYAAFTVILRL